MRQTLHRSSFSRPVRTGFLTASLVALMGLSVAHAQDAPMTSSVPPHGYEHRRDRLLDRRDHITDRIHHLVERLEHLRAVRARIDARIADKR
jgi:cobalamin-dependent methionine synthase I